MQVEIKNIPELRAAAVAHVGPYNTISEAFGRLGASPLPARSRNGATGSSP